MNSEYKFYKNKTPRSYMDGLCIFGHIYLPFCIMTGDPKRPNHRYSFNITEVARHSSKIIEITAEEAYDLCPSEYIPQDLLTKNDNWTIDV